MRVLLTVILLALGADVAAQSSAPCSAPEHRRFDFWIGDWTVTNPAGKHAGDNTIEAVAGGCALHESWRGAGGSIGYSYSAYDALRKVWHQTWVDKDGLVLLLDGGIQDGKMVLTGPTGRTLNRVSWEPRKDGSVRQLGESSEDQGKTWKVQFAGLYRKK